MQNKILATLVLAAATVYPSLGMEENYIMVQHNPTQARVEVLHTNNLRITPLETYTNPLKITAHCDNGTNFIVVAESNDVLETPTLDSFEQTGFTQFVFQSPTGIKLHTDITNVDPLISSFCYHDIHNAGYVHAANEQTYVECTLGLAANGCLKLNPKSQMGQQLNQSFQQAQLQNNPLAQLLNIGLTMYANHTNQAATMHQGQVDRDCSIASIMLRPALGNKIDAPINGNIKYGQNFSMDLTTQGIALEFQPNNNFRFLA